MNESQKQRSWPSTLFLIISVIASLGWRFIALLFLSILVLAALGNMVLVIVILIGIVPSVLVWLFHQILGSLRLKLPWHEIELGQQVSERFKPSDIHIQRQDSSKPKPPWANGQTTNPGTLKPNKDLRIGIILSGGGAKGVYQAGALHALWEFLKHQEAEQYVKAVAGTSIGAWNAMFWLTKKIESGMLFDWWASAEPYKLIGPTFFLPWRNFLLNNDPWTRQFNELFSKEDCHKLFNNAEIHFYFTRTNVSEGRIEFSTNRCDDEDDKKDHKIVKPEDGHNLVTERDELSKAVFVSMDIPPVFKRMDWPLKAECEDGGVL